MEFILPFSITLGLILYGIIARNYWWPFLKRQPLEKALQPLLLFHGFRYIGLAFLITGVTAQPLSPLFAKPAAYGDLITALLAILALGMLSFSLPARYLIVWVFNVFGLLDLLNALYRGFLHTPDGHLGATYFIPAVIVPALLVTHILIFLLLLRPENKKVSNTTMSL
jgi:hypothetical protein